MKKYKMVINGEKYEAKIKEYKHDHVVVEVNGVDYGIELEREEMKKAPVVRSQRRAPEVSVAPAPKKPVAAGAGAVVAPIPGLVMRILVKEGDNVNAGDPILILEAMKMESEIASTATGVVKSIAVKEGDSVQESQVLIEIGA